MKSMRHQYRRGLKDNAKYDNPPVIPPMEWNEIIEDAKDKRLHGKKKWTKKGQKKVCHDSIKYNEITH